MIERSRVLRKFLIDKHIVLLLASPVLKEMRLLIHSNLLFLFLWWCKKIKRVFALGDLSEFLYHFGMVDLADTRKVITLCIEYHHFGIFLVYGIAMQCPQCSVISGVLSFIEKLLCLYELGCTCSE